MQFFSAAFLSARLTGIMLYFGSVGAVLADSHRPVKNIEKSEMPVQASLDGYWKVQNFQPGIWYAPCFRLYAEDSGQKMNSAKAFLYYQSYGTIVANKCIIPDGSDKEGNASVIDEVNVSQDTYEVISEVNSTRHSYAMRSMNTREFQLTSGKRILTFTRLEP